MKTGSFDLYQDASAAVGALLAGAVRQRTCDRSGRPRYVACACCRADVRYLVSDSGNPLGVPFQGGEVKVCDAAHEQRRQVLRVARPAMATAHDSIQQDRRAVRSGQR